MKCPRCGKENDDNWTLKEGDGGCQGCWEDECNEAWWDMFKRQEGV